MKNGMFKGWKEVFGFTFEQNVKNKSFKIAIISLSLLMFVVFFAINIGMGYYKNKDKKESKKEENQISTIYILDESDIQKLELQKFSEFDEYLSEVNINIAEDSEEIDEIIRKADEAEENVIAFEIKNNSEEKCYEILVKQSSACEDENVDKIAEIFEEYFSEQKLLLSGIEEVKMNVIMSENGSSVIDVDEADKTFGEIMLGIFLPMIVVLAMYMLVLLHGQSISKNLMIEKNSKLMETLLVSVKPYAIILGKVLAMYLIAIIEIATWIISGILGYVISNEIAKSMFDGYKNPIGELIGLVQDNSASAFSTEAYILCILSVFIGFMAYCVLSGLITSNITKAEDLANGTTVFQMIVVIAYLLAYLVPLMDAESVLVKVMRYVPVTSAFMLPSDILLGNISMTGSAISLGLLVISIVIMIFFTGKIYKKKVF